MRRALTLTAALGSLAVPCAASANTHTVGPGGPGVVAAAVAAAGDGDTVHILPGAYSEPAITVTHAVRIEGEAGTSITATDATKPLFTVTHAGVAIATVAAASTGQVVLSQAPDLTLDGDVLTRTAGGDAPVVEVDGTPTTGTTTIARSLIANATGGSGHTSPAVMGGPANSLANSDSLIVSGAGEGPALRFAGGTANSLVRSVVEAIASGSDAVQAQSTTTGAKALKIDSAILSGGSAAASLRATTSNTLPGAVGDLSVSAVHATIAGAATAINAAAGAAGLLAAAGNVAVIVDRSIVRGTTTTSTCGCVQPNTSAITVTASDTSSADIFVSSATKDFHLRADAPVIDKGGPAVAGESDRDVDGQARAAGAASDLGADEFVNQPPVGRLAAPAAVRTPAATTFDASASTDPEARSGGGIATYHFDFGDGTGADSARPTATHAYAHPGTYVARVSVTDAQGLTGAPSAPVQAVVGDGIAPTARTISPHKGSRLRARGPIRFTGAAADDTAVASVRLVLQRSGTKRVNRFAARVTQGIWSYKVRKGLKLRRGRYTLTVVAVDAAGNLSSPVRVRFTLK